jgi:hypothetical protein
MPGARRSGPGARKAGSRASFACLDPVRTRRTGVGRGNMINEVKNLGLRLADQTTKPELVALGLEVTAFHSDLKTARTGQQGLEGDTGMDSTEIEGARQAVANALYGNLGMLMHIYHESPETVAGFFDLDTLPAQRAGRAAAADPAGESLTDWRAFAPSMPREGIALSMPWGGVATSTRL